MKEAVLKIIRERIADHEKVLSSPRTLPDAYSVVSAYRYECRAIMEEVSALPEQGAVQLETLIKDSEGERYTKDQIEKSFNAGASAWELCYEMQDEVGFEEMKTKFLSSLTPVAVEAERTERWIPVTERLPEPRKHVVVWLSNSERTTRFGRDQLNGFNQWMLYPQTEVTHWKYIEGPDSLAPQVNNDKTK